MGGQFIDDIIAVLEPFVTTRQFMGKHVRSPRMYAEKEIDCNTPENRRFLNLL